MCCSGGGRRIAKRDGACGRAWRQTGVTPAHATDLLIAFRQDAVKSRYATIDELYNYCHYSAVPVGRYVLDLHGETMRAIRRPMRCAHRCRS